MTPIYDVSCVVIEECRVFKRPSFDSAPSFFSRWCIQIEFAIIDELLSESFPEKLNQIETKATEECEHQFDNSQTDVVAAAASTVEGDDFIAFY